MLYFNKTLNVVFKGVQDNVGELLINLVGNSDSGDLDFVGGQTLSPTLAH